MQKNMDLNPDTNVHKGLKEKHTLGVKNKIKKYRIYCNKRRVSNKCRPLISATIFAA